MLNIDAVVRVLDKRTGRGATDKNLIIYLQHLRAGAWKNAQHYIDELIIAIKASPLKY